VNSRFARRAPPADLARVAEAALAWFDGDSRSRVVVGADLTLLWSNPEADALFAKLRDIEVRDGMLTMADPLRQKTLLALVDSPALTASCCIPKSDGNGFLLIRARRAPVEDEALFALLFVDSGQGNRCTYQDLDVAFGLTKAEHRVLLELLHGQEADSLTKLLGVSIETVRSHIRNIYGKLEVNSREQLFFKTQPFRV
jgi:DNA-binding CsgD family transcriptional regulator